MPKTLDSISFIELLPQSMARDAGIAAAAAGLDAELKRVAGDLHLVELYARIDTLPEAVIDELAWQLSVDVWLPGLELERKRALVKTSIAWHRRKGTPWAVRTLLGFLGVEAVVVSCAQAKGRLGRGRRGDVGRPAPGRLLATLAVALRRGRAVHGALGAIRRAR